MMPVFDVKKKAMEMNPRLVQWRRTIHAAPEVGFNTPVTEKFIV